MNCLQPTVSWKCNGKWKNDIHLTYCGIHNSIFCMVINLWSYIAIHNGINLIKHAWFMHWQLLFLSNKYVATYLYTLHMHAFPAISYIISNPYNYA